MDQAHGVVLVGLLGINEPLGQRTRQVRLGQARRAVGLGARGVRQQVVDKLLVGQALVWLQRKVTAGQARVVLDGVVLAEVGEVEAAGPVGAVQEVGSVLWHEEAEGRGEVVRLADLLVHLLEGDVLAVVRQDAVVGEGVEGGAGAAGVAVLGRNKLGPLAPVAGAAAGDDMAGLEGGREQVDDEEHVVPGEDVDVDEEAGNLADDAHGGGGGGRRSGATKFWIAIERSEKAGRTGEG